MVYLLKIIQAFTEKHQRPPTNLYLTPYAALCLTVKHGAFSSKIGDTVISIKDFSPKNKEVESLSLGVFIKKGDLRAVDL